MHERLNLTLSEPAQRRCRALLAGAAGVLALALSGASALAGGGVGVPDPPKVTDAFCLDHCAGTRKATEGSKIELTGKNLGNIKMVSFDGSGGDRVSSPALKAEPGLVIAKVPDGAKSGNPHVRGGGASASSPAEIEIVGRGQIPDPGSFKLLTAEATPDKAFYDGKRPATLHYTFKGGERTDIRVDVVSIRTGALIETSTQRARHPFAENTVRWDGIAADGKPAANGRYEFRIGALRGDAPEARPKSAFGLYGNEFPLRAKHTYGDGFGAGRGHDGQDVMANCGSRIVVARGGVVTFNDFQSAAGNYLVIDAKGDGHDYMYAHLRQPSPLKEGRHVKTGQTLGHVGQTGDATACHLHFEYWKAPWQQGGRPLPSVTRVLKEWDSWS
jgi:murein DD-endopeptidase MepM/ murein hydrolase activator NlpD